MIKRDKKKYYKTAEHQIQYKKVRFLYCKISVQELAFERRKGIYDTKTRDLTATRILKNEKQKDQL